MREEFEVRPFLERDAVDIANLVTLKKFKALSNNYSYVACFCDMPVAAIFYLTKGNYLHIKHIIVDKKFRRMGCGTSLLEHTKVMVDVKSMIVEVPLGIENLEALNFFKARSKFLKLKQEDGEDEAIVFLEDLCATVSCGEGNK